MMVMLLRGQPQIARAKEAPEQGAAHSKSRVPLETGVLRSGREGGGE